MFFKFHVPFFFLNRRESDGGIADKSGTGWIIIDMDLQNIWHYEIKNWGDLVGAWGRASKRRWKDNFR